MYPTACFYLHRGKQKREGILGVLCQVNAGGRKEVSHFRLCSEEFPSQHDAFYSCFLCMTGRQKGNGYTLHSGAALLEEENFLWRFAPVLTNLLSKLQENLFPHLGPSNNMVLIYRKFLDVWQNHSFTFPCMGTLTQLLSSAFIFTHFVSNSSHRFVLLSQVCPKMAKRLKSGTGQMVIKHVGRHTYIQCDDKFP